MNRIFASFFVVGLLLSSASVSLAQETEPAGQVAATPDQQSAGVLRCSDYYRFGSVSVELVPTVQTTVPGSLMTFAGAIKNDNAYPLLDGTLYVKIFKRNNRTFQAGDGNEVVDQFVANNNLTLRTNGTLDTTFTWKVPMNAEGGEYYAAYFYTTHKRYNLAGISYTDEVVGNQASFTIKNDAGTAVAKLSKLDTTLNAQDYFFKGALDRFGASETVTVETTVVNPTDEEKRLPLQWNQYSGSALNPDNLRHTKTELVTVPANNEKTISYEVRPQSESVVYVTAVTQDKDVKSILNVRYTRKGIEEATLNFSGLSTFPLSKDSAATLFACAQATTEQRVPGNTVTLSLKDKDGKVLHEYRYEGDIIAARSGFGENFTPITNINYATLTATLERNGTVVEEVTQVYDCEAIDPASCLPEEGLSGFFDFLKTYLMQILLTMVIVLLIAAILIYVKKRPRRENINAMSGPGVTPLLLLFALMAAFVALAPTASAQQGPCILGPEEEVGGQDGFVDQRGGSACIARNYIEPPSGGLGDHQSESFYGGCNGLGEGDWSSTGGCISRVDSFRSAGAPSDGCTVYGHYCEQGGGTGEDCGPIGYDATTMEEFRNFSQGCIDQGFTNLYQSAYEPEGGQLPDFGFSQGCFVGRSLNPEAQFGGGYQYALYTNPSASCSAPTSCNSTNIERSSSGACAAEGYDAEVLPRYVAGSSESHAAYAAWSGDSGDGSQCAAVSTLGGPKGLVSLWSGGNMCPADPPSSCTAESQGAQWYSGGQQTFIAGEGLSSPFDCAGEVAGQGGEYWNREVVYDAASEDPYFTNCYMVTNPTGLATKANYIAGPPSSRPIEHNFDSGRSCDGAPTGGNLCSALPQETPTAGQCNDWGYDQLIQKYQGNDGYFLWTEATNQGTNTGECIQTKPAQTDNEVLSAWKSSACVSNAPPATPTITGPTSGVVNAVLPYTFTVSAEDLERNNLRYGITDAACSTVYEWLPGNGVVPSGTAQSFDRTFNTDGSYTLYVLAEDESFARSSCAQHTITISPAAAPTADLKLDGSDGPLDVGKNTQHTLTWMSANAASCTLFGEGMGAVGTTVTATGTMPVTISQSNSFTMTCSGAPDEVVVNVVNQPPAAPAVTHPTGNAPFDTLTTFNIQGNDPDGDDVFYEVDWDLTDSIDFNTTTSGGVSNSIQMASRAFAASGPQRIRARTVDVPGGLRSGWTEYMITIDTAPAPVATLEVAVNGGSFSTGDQTVNPGDTVSIRWDSSNASSCDGSGSGFDTGGRTNGTDGVNTPAPNSQTTFTATCTGPGGEGSTSLTITVRQLPNLSKPNITYQLSPGFDPATGAYNYVDMFFNTSNNGGSDTRASADYRFEFDSGRNGYELTRTGSLGLFTVGQTVPRTERVQGPIIFGNSRVRVTVDSTDVVTETDETDNDRSVDLTFVPPDPGLSITADRQQLREGETTTVRWSSQATYPLDCRVSGPNVEVNPSGLTGTRQTAGIMAKSVFTFTCIEPITGTEFSTSVSVESAGTIEET